MKYAREYQEGLDLQAGGDLDRAGELMFTGLGRMYADRDSAVAAIDLALKIKSTSWRYEALLSLAYHLGNIEAETALKFCDSFEDPVLNEVWRLGTLWTAYPIEARTEPWMAKECASFAVPWLRDRAFFQLLEAYLAEDLLDEANQLLAAFTDQAVKDSAWRSVKNYFSSEVRRWQSGY